MRKCTGNHTHKWGFDAISKIMCNRCGARVEFFQDEITRNVPECKQSVTNDRKDFGCTRWCSAQSPYPRNICPAFKWSKDRFYRGF